MQRETQLQLKALEATYAETQNENAATIEMLTQRLSNTDTVCLTQQGVFHVHDDVVSSHAMSGTRHYKRGWKLSTSFGQLSSVCQSWKASSAAAAVKPVRQLRLQQKHKLRCSEQHRSMKRLLER